MRLNILTKRQRNNERGQGLTEYAVVLSLVAVAGIFSVSLLGSSLRAKFGELTGQVTGNSGIISTSTARLTAVSGLAGAAATNQGKGMANSSGDTSAVHNAGSE